MHALPLVTICIVATSETTRNWSKFAPHSSWITRVARARIEVVTDYSDVEARQLDTKTDINGARVIVVATGSGNPKWRRLAGRRPTSWVGGE